MTGPADGEPVRLTTNDDSYSRPRFSPDGKTLCFNVAADASKYYALDRLGCTSWPSMTTVRKITQSFDRSVGAWDYSPESRDIYFTVAIAHVLAEAPFLLRML